MRISGIHELSEILPTKISPVNIVPEASRILVYILKKDIKSRGYKPEDANKFGDNTVMCLSECTIPTLVMMRCPRWINDRERDPKIPEFDDATGATEVSRLCSQRPALNTHRVFQ